MNHSFYQNPLLNMWTFFMGLLCVTSSYAMHYVCSSLTNQIHYYSTVSYPLPRQPLHKISDCYQECSPCVVNDRFQVMIGHHALCTPTMEQQTYYQLVNSTILLENTIDTTPFTGVYHSYRTLPFISHGYLCVYPLDEDMMEEETEIYSSTSIYPQRVFQSPL